MIMRYISVVFGFLLIAFAASGQEVLTGLSHNPVIKQELKQLESKIAADNLVQEVTVATIPFFDDFHQEAIFPDPIRWKTDETFINADFPYHSVNVGAATFDAIDGSGNLYPDASIYPFIADNLISNLIRLDSVFSPTPRPITVADSVYFSFFYQPQGRANAPEEGDSLVLQFGVYSGDSVFDYIEYLPIPMDEYIFPGEVVLPFDTLYPPPECDPGFYYVALDTLYHDDTISMPCDSIFGPETEWYTVWSSEGMRLDSFYSYYNTYSKQVMIPITDSARYFKNNFQVRFFNYASLSSANALSRRSNTDQWNVDYVYLNINRNQGHTTYRKISFAERAPSMLRRYEAMPYNQYKNDPTNLMADSALIYITNLDDEAYNTDYWYRVEEVEGSYSHLYDGGGCNLPPFYSFGYQRCDGSCGNAHACPPVNFIYPLGFGEDSALFRVEHRINGFTAADTIGDTIQFYQKFYNYFAYDDGTPEAGYGVNTVFGRVAYRFKLNTNDTLRAINMYFNRTQGDANDQLFSIVVWRDNNGEPGEAIYIQDNVRPRFTDNLYQLSTYYLDEPVFVSDVFYIGWLQTTIDILNIGWDLYRDASSNVYYNTIGEWEKTAYKGSMMMRPVLGKEFDPEGLEEVERQNPELYVFPNPTRGDILNIKISGLKDPINQSSGEISIFNMFGQLVMSSGFKKTLDISELSNGMYIIRYNNKYLDRTLTGKFLVNAR